VRKPSMRGAHKSFRQTFLSKLLAARFCVFSS
jgi:hypothetical protein